MLTISYEQVKPLPESQVIKVYGPPGTGKTTTLMVWMDYLVKQGVIKPEEILATGYSRAAVEALALAMQKARLWLPKRKKNEDAKHPSNASSIMQLLWAGGDLGGNILRDDTPFHRGASIYNFLADHRVDPKAHLDIFTNIMDMVFKVSTPADFDIFKAANSLQIPPENMPLVNLIEPFIKYQESIELFSYPYAYYNYLINPDLTVDSVVSLLPPIGMLVVDEAQDMTPLMADFIDRLRGKLAPNLKHVVYAGDDDQAIYNYAGADYKLFNNIDGEIVVLDRTFRYGKRIHSLGNHIISKVKARFDKIYKPGGKEDVVLKFTKPLDKLMIEAINYSLPRGETVFILKRINRGLRKLSKILEQQYLPHVFVRETEDPSNFIDYVYSEDYKEHKKNIDKFKAITEALAGILVYEPPVNMLLPDLNKILDFNIDGPFDRSFSLRASGPAAIRKMAPFRQSLIALLANEDRLEAFTEALRYLVGLSDKVTPQGLKKYILTSVNDRIRIGSIHSAKGLEADHVVLHVGGGKNVVDALAGSQPEKDNELRVWYVGVTRAKKTLTLTYTDARIYQEVIE